MLLLGIMLDVDRSLGQGAKYHPVGTRVGLIRRPRESLKESTARPIYGTNKSGAMRRWSVT